MDYGDRWFVSIRPPFIESGEWNTIKTNGKALFAPQSPSQSNVIVRTLMTGDQLLAIQIRDNGEQRLCIN